MKRSHTPYQQDTHSIDIKDIFRKILQHWIYYVITAIVLGGITVAYLKLAEPVYIISTTLLVDDHESKASETELLIQEVSPGVINLENEIGLIQSYNVVQEAIKALDFEVSYFEKDMLKLREKYHDSPFWVRLDTSSYQLRGVYMNIQPLSAQKFKITVDDVAHEQVCQFGEECSSEYFKFTVFKGFKEVPVENDIYYIMINDMEGLTEQYRSNLVLSRKGYESTLLELSIYGSLPKKEQNFLNELCKVITQRNLQEKNHIASRTINFINSQLTEVSDSLKGAENQLENFKIQENVMDISLAASSASTKLTRLESEQADLKVKQKYYDYLLKYMRDSTDINSIVAPASIGIADPLLNELIIELKKLHNEKVALNYTRTTKSNELNLLNLQIEHARKTLIENVSNILESSTIALEEVNTQIAGVRRIVDKLPENERDLMRIQRMFNLSDNLYNYLLQKRAEAGIAKAANLPDHKIVDQARILGGEPISPKAPLAYILASVLTLVLPTLFILAKVSLNDNITDPDQIEKLTAVPIAGKITHKKGSQRSIFNAPNSSLAESFRTLRVNLQYFSFRKEHGVIGITSTVSGEGKTFCAYNLASMVAMAQKKVILVEADLRQPKLIQYNKNLTYHVGLSSYLIGQADWQEIVQPTHINNLHMISCGPIPPNPVELLESPDFKELLSILKQNYDYVIIDSPPAGLVTDYMTILNSVDITLYVVRMDYSKSYFITNLEKDFQHGKYKNLSLIVNDVKRRNGSGGRYDQYYRQNGKSKQKPINYNVTS